MNFRLNYFILITFYFFFPFSQILGQQSNLSQQIKELEMVISNDEKNIDSYLENSSKKLYNSHEKYQLFSTAIYHYLYKGRIREADSLQLLFSRDWQNFPDTSKVRFLTTSGYIQFYSDNLNEGVNVFLTALEICERTNDEEGIITISNNLGAAYINLGEFNKAQVFFENILPKLLVKKDSFSLTKVYNNLGIVFMEQNNYMKADTAFSSALSYNKDSISVLSIKHNLAIVHESNENYLEALDLFDEVIEKSIEFNRGSEIVSELKLSKAKCLKNIGKLKESSEILEEVLTNYSGVDSIKKKMTLYKEIEEIAIAKSDFESAYDNLKNHFSYFKTYTKTNSLAAVDSLRDAYEFEKMQKNIEDSKQELRNNKIISVFGFIITMFCFVFLYSKYNSTKKSEKRIISNNALLKEENTELIEKLRSRIIDSVKKVSPQDLLENTFVFNNGIKILFADITYLEKRGDWITFYTKTGKQPLEQIGTLKYISQTVFLEPAFVRIHNSYMINTNYIQYYSSSKVVLQVGEWCKVFPIGRSFRNSSLITLDKHFINKKVTNHVINKIET